MDETFEAPETIVPMVHPATSDEIQPPRTRRWRRTLQIGVALGVAAGVGIGATALASAATSGSGSPSSTSSGSGKGTPAQGGHRMFGGGFGGGLSFGGYGPVLHAVETVKGPNGYETLQIQNGTVTSATDVSGSTWKLVVTSADKTALTYTVNSGSSVNGGEMGIGSVAAGDTVSVVATVSGGTATVKSLTDMTKLQANRSSWTQKPAKAPSGTQSGEFGPGGFGGAPGQSGSGSTT